LTTGVGFSEVREMLESYLSDDKFLQAGGAQFPDFENTQHYVNRWSELAEEIQKASALEWFYHKWYWVIALAAAIRITKIWGEIKNERRGQAAVLRPCHRAAASRADRAVPVVAESEENEAPIRQLQSRRPQ
jgi:hypothetical protein